MQTEVYVQMFVVFLLILIGYIAKRTNLQTEASARGLIKFLFTIPLPILVLNTFWTTKITSELLNFSLISGTVVLLSILLSYLLGKAFKFDSKTIGTLLITSSFASTLLFALPFISSFYGKDELRILFLYDFVHALIAYTFLYYISGKFGDNKNKSLKHGIRTIIKTPMIPALIIGLILGLLHISSPIIITKLSDKIAAFFSPLILICIGVLVDFKYLSSFKNISKIFLSISIKMLFGFIVALLLTNYLGIEDVAQKIVLISAATPTAGLAVVFASENGLDVNLASSIIAISMLIGLITTPLIVLM